jgi:hypothetical protein
VAKKVTVRPLQDGDIQWIAEHLRREDQQELKASQGDDVNFERAIAAAVRCSSLLWTVDDGEPIAIFGAAPISLLHRIGTPWMLGTDRVKKQARTLVVKGRWYVARMAEEYPGGLINFVDVRNTLSVRWLKAVGFTIHPPEPYGAGRLPFHRFELERAS